MTTTTTLSAGMWQALTWFAEQTHPLSSAMLWPAGIPRTTFHALRRRKLVEPTPITVTGFETGAPFVTDGWRISDKGREILAAYKDARNVEG